MSELKVCIETKDFWLDGKRLLLTGRISEVLCVLALSNGHTALYSKFRCVWEDYDMSVRYDRHALQNLVSRLRKVIGGESIITRDGVGYVMTIPVVFVGQERKVE
jgi:DNA-binding response OmpR family regulator